MKASCDEEAHAFVIAVCRASSALTNGRSVRDGGDGFRRACVECGVESFERMFKREPENLLRANPPESRTANGASFWSGTKRLPRALAFYATDPRHATFVVAHAMLFSSLFLFDALLTSLQWLQSSSCDRLLCFLASYECFWG